MNRLVVVSNRVPAPSAGTQAGGLAVALDGLMEKRGGLWFGWSGVIAAGAAGRPAMIERSGSVEYATIDLTQDEHDRYYNAFSNSVLWPLLHTMPELMQYDRRDARVYREVNARMAAALQPLLRPTDLIWVHDYHLMPMAAALRARGVRNPIGFFLHIPFCSPDVLAAAPEMTELVREMLSADLIGFQTDNDVTNFAAAAQVLAGAMRGPGNSLFFGGRRIRLGVFPVEIEARSFAARAAEMAESPAVRRLRRDLEGQRLILGVERLDPTKGLLQRLVGLRRLLEKRQDWRGHLTMLQIAAMSRKDVESYRALRTALDREAGALNADLGEPDWQPLRLVARGVERSTVAGYMRLARVGLVTPLRDGMNLVAKEFVAAQDPADPGVLVLSRFAGSARQLEAALLVNPHDPDAMADALDSALRMGLEERQARWRALWAAIEHRSPLVWGRSFVAALLRASTLTVAKTPVPLPVPVAERPIVAPRIALERVGSEMEPAFAGAGAGKPGGRVLN
ncbi:Trehalose-6-phosphate synthase [Rhodovastum atsumiense]|uniref:Trehalose-6-phosphate synthase n=1 Tax=Rhodovastum atsumiense TaxID=504468 RepID=A0A5M6IRK1_9PROT|nr:trehalose-6-phosphate synthase [Rhodovastum atsumiense]KAA5610539.1 trehalose-6-phosphate synthase [Rhodovastum atsumiense]CAH2605013.1 Trehalose-6-phosphate synthase [Rhodovastum atsumiense]